MRLNLALRYRLLLPQGKLVTGSGTTRDVSSAGVLFEAEAPLAVADGDSIELSIAWPVPYHGTEPSELNIYGLLVRATENTAAMRIMHYEFAPWRPPEAGDSKTADSKNTQDQPSRNRHWRTPHS